MKTTKYFIPSLISLLQNLTQSMSLEVRYQQLLQAWSALFLCDACVLLKLENDTLIPQASMGLNKGFMGRRFEVVDHPRLERIMKTQGVVRFSANSTLPDPYDGLIDTPDGHYGHLNVHDCMGAKLYLEGRIWGVITLDALSPDCFNTHQKDQLEAFLRLTEVVIKTGHLVERLARQVRYQEQITTSLLVDSQMPDMLGESPVMSALSKEIKLLAPSDLNALIVGESGVGKELVAHTIHYQSNRNEMPFVAVNCAALPESLVESELFGHLAGAFSGAHKDRLGKFELAHKGTFFLDEVGELPLSVQAKLLRVLQSGELQRVGSDKNHYVDVRIIAATNRDLKQEIIAGRFRADLYHRLNVYPLNVPPLRERGNDILLLANHFLARLQRQFGANSLCLTQAAQDVLLCYEWMGNVRELEHVLSRAALKAIARFEYYARIVTLDVSDLNLNNVLSAIGAVQLSDAMPVMESTVTLKQATERFQREYIQQQIERQQGNRAAAATQLGIARGNLHRLMKRLGI